MNEPTKDESPRASLSPEVLTRLRTALEHWASEQRVPESELRTALHVAAAEARERGVRAEELVVVLKTTWFSVAAPPAVPTSASQRRLDELVTACIKAYYE